VTAAYGGGNTPAQGGETAPGAERARRRPPHSRVA
jgi:hypothetical protein